MAGYSSGLNPGPSYGSYGDDPSPSFAPESGLDVRAKEFVPGAPKSNPRRDRQSNGNRDSGVPSRGGRFYGPPHRGRHFEQHFEQHFQQATRPFYQGQDGASNDRFPQQRRPNHNRGRQWTPQNSGRDQGARAAMVADTASFLASASSNNVPEQGQSETAGRQPQRQPKYYNRSNPNNYDNKAKWNGYNQRDRNGGNWSRSRQNSDYEGQNENFEPPEREGNSSRSRDNLQNGPEGAENGEYRNRKQNYNHNSDWSQGRGYYNRNNYDKRKNNYDNMSPRNYGSRSNYSGGYRDNKFNGYGDGKIKQHFSKEGDESSQRERLIEQLTSGALECLVCCDRLRQQDPVWNCSNCFHVLHLKCVIQWAQSSKEECGWRCPACQNVTKTVPTQYRCFCGALMNPQWNRHDTPHSCGDVCGKSRTAKNCPHHCLILCHPGPCPPCAAWVTRTCGCGRSTSSAKCSSGDDLVCTATCDKDLNCGVHKCTMTCHNGACPPCDVKIKQDCFCGKQSREVECIPENQGVSEFSCEEKCGRGLLCGNHECGDVCHAGACKTCELIPENVTHCPCGKMDLREKPEHARKSCTDEIPTCGQTCAKRLPCGQPSAPHSCKALCHIGACPPCDLETLVRCRCGIMDKKIPCVELTTKADDARCGKKCTKKRVCGKHRCNQLCCIEIDHPCPLPCNHLLSCGQHRCEQLCHCGRCRPCWRTSFDELHCYCGAAVIFPPVPCGTKPPACSRPCTREHDCEHDPLHNCHSEPTCPPCTVLTARTCHGGHETRKSVPCHQKELSCGRPCNKELSCGRHRCVANCHKGECLPNGAACTQPCTTLRQACQHPCNAPCHEGRCPETPCKETVRVTCECGHRAATRVCADNTREYQKIAVSLLASKMDDMQLGLSVDLGDIMGNPTTRKLYLKPLECSDECKLIQRNQMLAISLQIRNPDLSAKLTPRYSDSMRDWAKKDPAFCQMVHDRLTELVKLAKESKQKSRSYSFKEMNSSKRQFVHEYCDHFGCESMAYDAEPKRNVVATAQRDKAWLPSVSLLELIQREQGQRKVPGPAVLSSVRQTSTKPMESLAPRWPSVKSGTGPGPGPSAGAGAGAEPTSYMAAITRNPSSASTSAPPPRDSSTEEAASSSTSTYIDYFNS